MNVICSPPEVANDNDVIPGLDVKSFGAYFHIKFEVATFSNLLEN